jgi:hypothetical protein
LKSNPSNSFAPATTSIKSSSLFTSGGKETTTTPSFDSGMFHFKKNDLNSHINDNGEEVSVPAEDSSSF